MNNRSANTNDEISLSDFKQIVANVSGTSMDSWIQKYVTTQASPPLRQGDISILSGSGRIYQATAVEPTDRDDDGYYSDFGVSIRADTTLDDTDVIAGSGDPYFEIRVEGETIRTTDEVRSALKYEDTIQINEESLERFDRGDLNMTVVLWDGDVTADDVVDEWSWVVNYEPESNDRSGAGETTTPSETVTPPSQVETAVGDETEAATTVAPTTITTTSIPVTSTPTETERNESGETTTAMPTRTDTEQAAQTTPARTASETPTEGAESSGSAYQTTDDTTAVAGSNTRSSSQMTEAGSSDGTGVPSSSTSMTSDGTATGTSGGSEGTETSTTGPGFGVIGAIVALVAGALLAVRRT
ncbi:hypothetical protein BRC77_14500 [Halobacteriales archaeon QH_8_64_26]|nr:MAG: hypothetical protein BRC77_14500 [Halobacteriales archaeon QH_8_64_26]